MTPLHEVLRQMMLHADVTQVALADDIGVTQGAVSRWLSGENDVPLDVLPIAEALCGRPKGWCLQRAGYVREWSCTVLHSIAADPNLNRADREQLSAIYKTFLKAKV